MLQQQSYVKFEATWFEEKAVTAGDIAEVNRLRSTFRDLHLIGEKMAVIPPADEPRPVGFGNVSVRKEEGPGFIITGTNTGGFDSLSPEQYSLVTSVDIPRNTLTCRGLIKASAESMTHSGIYEAIPAVRFVGHAHSPELWNWAMSTPHKFAVTPASAEYGTPAIALAVRNFCAGYNGESGVIVMGGHEEGILLFGRSAFEVEELAREMIAHKERCVRGAH